MTTSTSGASRRGEEPPEQRQTGLCSMQRPVILLSGLPPDLPDGFIRQTYRQVSFQRPDRPASPVARPAASPASHTSLPYRQPDRQPHRPASPASLTSQPNRPARPASPTDQPDQPARPTRPATLDQPSTPAKVPPACLTDRLRSAGRRLRGWRSSRHG